MQIDASSKVCPVCKYEFAKFSLVLKIVAVGLILLFLYMMFT